MCMWTSLDQAFTVLLAWPNIYQASATKLSALYLAHLRRLDQFGYVQVCGCAVLGYKYNSLHAFINYGAVNNAYVDGVSITSCASSYYYLDIYTYATGYKDSTESDRNCPCT